MPIRGENHTARISDEAPFFRSLSDFDDWVRTSSRSRKLHGVLPYTPTCETEGTLNAKTRGKLLVCHDYKGGYVESATAPSYTFNFWPYCETFIYFSHHRVTIPPSGWSTAAHRHGVKMLGTLIFEHAESQPDCLRLLVGALPQSRTGPAKSSAATTTLPVSPHYARLLAELANQRGFDGYLLNFEAALQGGVEQTRALTMWITILERELKSKVGAHAEVIWYDSIIVDGRLRWQDRLNSLNLPFFLPSTGFFANYTWPSSYPSMSARYFLSIDQSSSPLPKTMQDLYIGVDTWGRGSHGGGGFGIYRAMSHIDPEALGLSVALFGQGWTWESEQDKLGWSWQSWWEYERKLWLGPQTVGEEVTVPPLQLRDGELGCAHGPFKPISDFFAHRPPPNPADLPFFTNFCPGVGWAWFVRGVKVMHSETGWTDVDKTTAIGDLVFPRPTLAWEDGERGETVPAARSELSMDDAWLGSSSLVVSLSAPGSDAEDAFFRCLWLPIQSLSITPRKSYRMALVYKMEGPVDTDVGASVKALAKDLSANVEVTHVSTSALLPGGWTELIVDFVLPLLHPIDVLVAAGIVVGFTCEDPTQQVDFSIRIGSLSVFANPPPSPRHTTPHPKILWADHAAEQHSGVPFAGTLTWGTGVSLGPAPALTLTSPEDTRPLWVLDYPAHGFAYFNVYVMAHTGEGAGMPPEEAMFVGTTGLDGRENRFFVDPACVPDEVRGASAVRFLVQGVTARGHVLEWDECVFVDVSRTTTTTT